MDGRVKYFDCLKGIAIVGVVLIHSYNYLDYGDIQSSLIIYFLKFIEMAIRLSVPLFVALSGYFLSDKTITLKHLSKQLKRVLLPYLLVGAVFGILITLNGESIGKVLLKYFTFRLAGPYYYISLIIQFYLLSFLPIKRFATTEAGLLISLFITVFYSSLLIILESIFLLKIPILITSGMFPAFLFFFVLGTYIRKNEGHIRHYQRGIVIGMLISFFLLLTLNYLVLMGFSSSLHVDAGSITIKILDKLLAYSYSAFSIIVLLAVLNKQKDLRIAAFLGLYSFSIYLLHVTFLSNINHILIGLTTPILLKFMILPIVSIFLSILIVEATRLLFGNLFAKKYLGYS